MAAEFTYRQYEADVISGKELVGIYIRQAVERDLKDLSRQKDPDFPYRFDDKEAQRRIRFIQLLKYTRGVWAKNGETLKLEPWQQWVVACTFGWKAKGKNLRRFRKIDLSVARKNGKTTLSAAMLNSVYFLDKEPGAEIYCAATKKDQAKITYDETREQIRRNGILSGITKEFKQNSTIFCEATNSKIRVLGADSDTEDGLNPSATSIDEYQAHKTNAMLEVLISGEGAREQPLNIITFTAGTNLEYPAYAEERAIGLRVLAGLENDEQAFYAFYELDENDDWSDPINAVKANPNLGVSVSFDFIKSRIAEALKNPRQQTLIRTKNLNQWVDSPTVWIPDKMWQELGKKFSMSELSGRNCYIGCDLSGSIDLSAIAFAFPKEGDETQDTLVVKFFMPEQIIEQKTKQDHVPYEAWAKAHYIYLTPGNTVDQDYIEKWVREKVKNLNLHILGFGYDPWNATTMISHFQQEGVNMVLMRQGYQTLSPICKAFERAVYDGSVCHDQNPVLSWNLSCVELMMDPAGNIKPDKGKIAKSSKRIDGVIAAILAWGQFGVSGLDAEQKDSGYLYSV